MDRMGKAECFLAKPRQRPLAARSFSRHKDDPGAHFRELVASDLSDLFVRVHAHHLGGGFVDIGDVPVAARFVDLCRAEMK